MKWSVLNELLEKYYAGSSSADEERMMRELLAYEDLPQEFYDDRMLIAGLFGSEEIPEPSSDLNDRVMSAIDESEQNINIVSGQRHLFSIISAAATVVIIIGLWFLLGDKNRFRDTYSDPQLAYNETVEILNRVSTNLNKGRDQLEELSLINRTKSRLNIIPESRDAVADELKALKYIDNSIQMLGLDQNNNIQE
jgi:hypothetical protein